MRHRIAVIGGTGCGGRAVAVKARLAGHTVLTIARGLDTGPAPDLVCDRNDVERLTHGLSRFKPDVVLDHVAYTAKDAATLLRCLPTSVKTLLQISSAVIYGPARERPYHPSEAPAPSTAFARGKLDAENIARDWAGGARRTVIARLGALYGPGHAPLTPWGRDPQLVTRLRAHELLELPEQGGLQLWFSADHARSVLTLLDNDETTAHLANCTTTPWPEIFRIWALAIQSPPPPVELVCTERLASKAPPYLKPFLDALLNPPTLESRCERHTPPIEGFRQVARWLDSHSTRSQNSGK